jgi:ATP-dependent RNA helicase RhlE
LSTCCEAKRSTAPDLYPDQAWRRQGRARLAQAGIAAEAIHGNKSQGQRERVLAAFRKGEIRTLVATDIAARGIDVDGISHVVNFDVPNVPETYVHRIGRTARAGAQASRSRCATARRRPSCAISRKLIRMSIPRARSARRPAPRGTRDRPKPWPDVYLCRRAG